VLRPLGVLVAGKATSPADAISLLERLQPELLVTDLLFGNADEGGIAYLKQVLAVCPDVKVIVLATFDESQIVADAIAAGAPSLRAQTRAPRGPGRCRSPGLPALDFLRPHKWRRRPHAHRCRHHPAAPPAGADGGHGLSRESPLTRRELEILTLVAEGLSNADIARRLWITEQTVKFHLSNIYRKLGVSNRTQASRWAVLQQTTPKKAGHP
jgi:DNA-binding NarL/FixJ family response regulator